MNFKILLLFIVICLMANAKETSLDTHALLYNQPIKVLDLTANPNRLEYFLINANEFGLNAKTIYLSYVNPWNEILRDLGLKIKIRYLSKEKLDRPNDHGISLLFTSDRLP